PEFAAGMKAYADLMSNPKLANLQIGLELLAAPGKYGFKNLVELAAHMNPETADVLAAINNREGLVYLLKSPECRARIDEMHRLSDPANANGIRLTPTDLVGLDLKGLQTVRKGVESPTMQNALKEQPELAPALTKMGSIPEFMQLIADAKAGPKVI